ncbi:hypothetical protein KXV95_002399 [Aspergillus fumigatus]|nr:hypothetical protein CNMCM8057_005357 [Aspergillus fumigatus]KAH1296602.1 hypothetical protein KXX11_007796 [Aspergillus fumigatus]KAH1311628.1 hypothetical protein KXX47_005570 [Aspergillus fumigatus]KAH1404656.1 hypothetical protein KXX51_000300 [Aspergillus fumigatus]KAH1463514.1 hypothetical protein KXX13_005224 [Aspergillus fumigatus]
MSASAKGRGEKSFRSSLSALESAAKDVLSFTKNITTVDDLQRQKSDLQCQLDDAGVKIRELQESLNYEKRRNDDNFLKVEQLASGWAKKKTSLEARVREVADSSQSATKKKMEDLEQRTKGAEEDMLQCQRRLDEQIMKNRKLQTMLEESDFRLKTLNHDIAVGEVDLDEYGNQSIICELIFLLSGSLRKGFQSMEKRLKALSAKFFKSSTSTEPSRARENTEHIQTSNYSPRSQSIIPFPFANITCPREVLAQSIIANRLSTDILTPVCLPSPMGRMGIGEALERSSGIRPRQKAILRSLLVTAFESEEVRLRNELLITAVSDISHELQSLLQSREVQTFKQELQEFFVFAANVWKPVQGSQRWIRATSDLRSCPPHHWRDSERRTTSDFPLSSGSPSLVLFPHIFDVDEEEPLYHGLVWCVKSNFKDTAEKPSCIPPRLQGAEEHAWNETSTGTGPVIQVDSTQMRGSSEQLDAGRNYLERTGEGSISSNGEGATLKTHKCRANGRETRRSVALKSVPTGGL